MASIGCSSSPGPLQVRPVHRCREHSSSFSRIRFRLSQRCIVLASSSRGSNNDGREEHAWSSSRFPDAFSGWYGLENEGGGNFQGKDEHGGMLGAGLAGLLLVGGLTFATLSLHNKTCRNISAVKQNIKPLPTEQIVLSTSEDQSEEIAQVEDEISSLSSNNENGINGHNPDSATDYVSDKQFVNSKDHPDVSIEDDHSVPGQPYSLTGTVESATYYADSQSIPDGISDSAAFVSKGDDQHDNGLLQLSPEGVTKWRVEYSGICSGSNFGDTYMGSSDLINTEERFYSLDEINSIEHSDLVHGHDLSGNESNISSGYNRNNKKYIFESTLPMELFASSGAPAPSLVSSAMEVLPGMVLVPAVVDQIQCQTFTALQALKVIEADAQPGDLCTRREYARWLVSASNALSRKPYTKLYPAMYIENITERAFDDVSAEDPDFSYIQGLAEAGIISSKLSFSETSGRGLSSTWNREPHLFFPESPVSRQDLVSWKMVMDKKLLPAADRDRLYQISGFMDVEKIDPGAYPALVADMTSGEHGIISPAFGYTRLFQPSKPVTKVQAAVALAAGEASEIVAEELARILAESFAEAVVNDHTALVAHVENELNASFEQELARERERASAVEKLAEEARAELERIRAEREAEDDALLREKFDLKSEIEVISRLRSETEVQLQELASSREEVALERERISKLRKETKSERGSVARLQYELEVERKALSMARKWAEEEAKRARKLGRALEEARDAWIKHGIKIVVEGDLQRDTAAAGRIKWVEGDAKPQQLLNDGAVSRGKNLVQKLKGMMASEMKFRPSSGIPGIIRAAGRFVSALEKLAFDGAKKRMAAAIARLKAAADNARKALYNVSQKFTSN